MTNDELEKLRRLLGRSMNLINHLPEWQLRRTPGLRGMVNRLNEDWTELERPFLGKRSLDSSCMICGGTVQKYKGSDGKSYWYECVGCGQLEKDCVCTTSPLLKKYDPLVALTELDEPDPEILDRGVFKSRKDYEYLED